MSIPRRACVKETTYGTLKIFLDVCKKKVYNDCGHIEI